MAREWTELAYLQEDAGNLALFIFGLAVSFVFLVLAAQYESWSLPLAVILVVPMCLLCSISGVTLAGGEVNIFTQIGFVVLVGLACKNAILIVEVAKVRQEEGVARSGGGPGGCAAALAADPDDFVRLHLRGPAADPAFRGWRGDASGARHGRFQRHARRDVLRDFPHPRVLLHPPAAGAASPKRNFRPKRVRPMAVTRYHPAIITGEMARADAGQRLCTRHSFPPARSCTRTANRPAGKSDTAWSNNRPCLRNLPERRTGASWGSSRRGLGCIPRVGKADIFSDSSHPGKTGKVGAGTRRTNTIGSCTAPHHEPPHRDTDRGPATPATDTTGGESSAH